MFTASVHNLTFVYSCIHRNVHSHFCLFISMTLSVKQKIQLNLSMCTWSRSGDNDIMTHHAGLFIRDKTFAVYFMIQIWKTPEILTFLFIAFFFEWQTSCKDRKKPDKNYNQCRLSPKIKSTIQLDEVHVAKTNRVYIFHRGKKTKQGHFNSFPISTCCEQEVMLLCKGKQISIG